MGGGQANTPKALCRVLLAGRSTRHEASNEDNARAGVASPTIHPRRKEVVVGGYFWLLVSNAKDHRVGVRGGEDRETTFHPCSAKSGLGAGVYFLFAWGVPKVPFPSGFKERAGAMLHVL